MTFIVSLAHFCEVHGPSMIMCTQVVNDPKDLPNYYSPQLPESQFCQSCMFQVPVSSSDATSVGASLEEGTDVNTSLRSVFNTDNNSSRTTLTLEDQISGLLSGSSQPQTQKKRLMTLKTQSKRNPDTYFISTQFPINTEVYSSLRQTIVRVFTAETNADFRNPIVFGNSKHGYSIALTFSLVDKTARGSKRKYSIIVTSNWESDLFDNYIFILTNLNQVVRNILLTARSKENSVELDSNEIHNNDTFLKRSTGLPSAKSMVEILQDQKFFVKIHAWASFMLEALEDHKHV